MDIDERLRLEHEIRGIYLVALNLIASVATEPKVLRIVKDAIDDGNKMRSASLCST